MLVLSETEEMGMFYFHSQTKETQLMFVSNDDITLSSES